MSNLYQIYLLKDGKMGDLVEQKVLEDAAAVRAYIKKKWDETGAQHGAHLVTSELSTAVAKVRRGELWVIGAIGAAAAAITSGLFEIVRLFL